MIYGMKHFLLLAAIGLMAVQKGRFFLAGFTTGVVQAFESTSDIEIEKFISWHNSPR
jgi:hypothetical protein